MKRSPMPPRRSPLRSSSTLKPGKPLRPRSAKTVRVDAARRVLKKRLQAEDEMCRRCRIRAGTDLHERLRRSQGGDAASELVVVLICRTCHSAIHDRPQKARDEGWLVFRKDLLGREAA